MNEETVISLNGQWTKNKVLLMSGSCHLDRPSNVEIGVECQIFVIVIFFNCSQVLPFGAHSRYYKGALTQISLGICFFEKITTNIQH